MNKPATASSTSVLHSMGFKAFLATQFLGAFNDNVFKLLIICSAMNVLSPEASKSYVPLASAVFILPYLLFSGYAGFLADRYSKRQVMIGTKWLEVVIMLLGWWLFWQGAIYWLLPVLFLMGAQSAFFSPAKYGFLPEVLPEKHLPRGNGATQLFTFLAIIFGGWAGGELSEQFKDTLQNAAFFCVLVAILGVVTSYGITRTPSGNRSTRCAIDPLTPHLRTLLEVRRDPLLMTCFLGKRISGLWGVVPEQLGRDGQAKWPALADWSVFRGAAALGSAWAVWPVASCCAASCRRGTCRQLASDGSAASACWD